MVAANRATRSPDDQLRCRQGDCAGGRLGPFDHLHELGEDALCSPISVNANRGQRHHLEFGLRNIVEADDRYVAGDLPARLVKRS